MIDGKLWHNASVIGLPANDGTPRVWFSTLTPTGDKIVIEHHALGYDHVRAAQKMRERGLPEAYAQTLVSSIWDNCEILPETEANQQGRPRAECSQVWPFAKDCNLSAAE